MVYEYKNDNGEVIEINKSITEKIPKFIEKDGIKYHRVFSLGNGGIHIPEGFGATDNPIKFDKSPSRRKHFY